MTPNKAIEIVDRVKVNTYEEEDKLRWISDLDGMIKRLVFQWDERYLKELETQLKNESLTREQYDELIDKTKPYYYPDDMDKELLVPAPFEDVYIFYLQAQIDYHNKEYANYNNSALRFETLYNEYKKDYIRKHQAKG